ncbi:lysoplasmalogenase [Pantoea sp. 1.19]|uniref:lysoplasmalogenase n=1 Tax=Pantoea sp. 1.19 TaxID=1925589 RepID=UPI0009491257|nr:lysoplasmalogenase [Pantoea sp. 1.19]
MLWSFLAVVFSGWLYVDAAYRGPQWQRWLFKPLTLLLLLGLAWQAPMFSLMGWLVVAGLVATLLGDALLLLSPTRTLWAIGAFFLSSLLYTAYFVGGAPFAPHWPVAIALAIVAGLVLAIIWTRLETLKWAVAAFVVMLVVMAWLAFERYLTLPNDFSFALMVGTTLLLVAHILWLISHFRRRFTADRAIIAAGYFIGHFMVVRTLFY